MNEILLSNIDKTELVNELTENILNGLKIIVTEAKQNELAQKEWLTAKETETLLKISSVTRWTWTKAGILKSYKMNGKNLRYRKNEVLEALIRVENKKSCI